MYDVAMNLINRLNYFKGSREFDLSSYL